MFQFKRVDETEVRKLLKTFPKYGSVDPETQDSKVLVLEPTPFFSPICHIWNKCLTDGLLYILASVKRAT